MLVVHCPCHRRSGESGLKTAVHDLAFLGGESSFAEPVYTGAPNVTDRSRLFQRLSAMLDRNRLSNDGPLVREFEERVAALSGVRHGVAMCNATTALQVLARALGLSGEVLMPALTFPATPHAMAWLGLAPAFCDVDRHTANLDPVRTARTVSACTSAVMAVHLWGRPCDTDALSAVTAARRLPLLFDAAHAVGCTIAGRPVGAYGLASVFSFHATKVVNAFEGGALVTDDAGLADEARALRNFGYGPDQGVGAVGTNAKMSEAAAAMGLTSLDSFDEVVAHNERNHDRYAAELSDTPGIRLVDYDRTERNNFQYVIVEVDPAVGGRNRLQAALAAENVHTKRYFSPGCHELPPYRHARRSPLPHTETIASRVLALPTGTSIDEKLIANICAVIRLAMTHWSRS
jgi:dTDP-4-amino-4,6-dideoxy-D-glucose transaminase